MQASQPVSPSPRPASEAASDAADPASDSPHPASDAPQPAPGVQQPVSQASQPVSPSPRPASDAAGPAPDTPQPAPDAPRPTSGAQQPASQAPPPASDAPPPASDAPQLTSAPQPASDTPQPTPDGPHSTPAPPPPGIAGLKLGYQIAAACALVLVAVAACVHVGMLFLHVAPSNTLTKQHGDVVDFWIYPEFEQNWKLFAPNPLQQNIAVQARAELRTAEGGVRTTDWYDLSAQDGADIDGNLLPSHTQQNQLRRAWDFYVGSHDARNRPVGLRGQLSERYIRRIAYMRLDRERPGGKGDEIERVQLRSRTTNVQPPRWSEEKVPTKPVHRLLPWWSVTLDDLPLASGSGARPNAGPNTEGTAAR
ncbi:MULTISPECIES: DUF5819 family protein [Streptomyces]|uniref:DUF5819 family protein n=1 Tax=Streptomyces TaxID=1883 RepID=UPI001E483768|nr:MULTISPECIES: DUF5819 family protein [Streptomyces]UFQ20257.1 DUF5819 family protein [Streptomyces huasconensis]WCL89875.1 DUF5819 family protein [Streptomyces sp. JCM 35825]